MTASELSKLIREQMCSEIRVKALAGGNLAVATPLTFGDGDSCRLFVRPEPDGKLTITDGGHVLALAGMEGVDLLSEGHVDRFRRLAAFYGAEENGGELRITADVAGMGDALFSLTQACLELARLVEFPPESSPKKKAFTKRFTKSVEASVPKNRLTKNWFDGTSDPKGIYKADYRVDGGRVPWFVMGAGSPAKTWKSASTIQHYRGTSQSVQTVFAFSESVKDDAPAFAVLIDNANYRFMLPNERKAFDEFLRDQVVA
jgi:hypothetical protein